MKSDGPASAATPAPTTYAAPAAQIKHFISSETIEVVEKLQ